MIIPIVLAMVISLTDAGSRSHAQQTSPPAPTLEEVNQAIASGQLEKSVERLGALDLDAADKLPVAMTLASLAILAQREQQLELAVDSMGAALARVQHAETDHSASTGRETQLRRRLFQALAAIYLDCRQRDDGLLSIVTLEHLATCVDLADDSTRSTWVEDAFGWGKRSLQAGDAARAERAYQTAHALGTADQVASAALGLAWAALVDPDRQPLAAQRLETFIHQCSEHPDAAFAARACINCYDRLGQNDKAGRVLATLFELWPNSASAVQIAHQQAKRPSQPVSESVRGWILRRSRTGSVESWSPELISTGIQIAVHAGEEDAIESLTARLSTSDHRGQATADLLARLQAADQDSHAERVATALISPAPKLAATAQSREAACRWAARAGKWQLIAIAATQESIETPSPSRSAAVERLFAEAMVQVGRMSDALPWWNRLVENRKSDDFATLLRCAEAETAIGTDSQLAQQRIESARRAAGQDAFAIALVDLLAAELAIRRSKFDRARSLLENVIGSVETDRGLRGRAQWLIGETFYIQRKFSDAIEAYRRVEGIDRNGPWVAASLVQAGKSFEQLGRTREAAVCYAALLGRFADSPHADAARTRMASLPSQTQLKSPHSPNLSTRR